MHNPDFIQIAKGYGIKGKQVSKREDLSNTLITMLQHDGPFILEVKVKKENNWLEFLNKFTMLFVKKEWEKDRLWFLY